MTSKSRRGRVLVTVRDALLIGGHSEASGFLDAATARQDVQADRLQGADAGRAQPVIPASTLRGALREATLRLVRGRAALAGKDPKEIERAGCSSYDVRCEPDRPCPVCRIFGRRGPDRPGVVPQQEGERGGPGGLFLADALRVEQHRPPAYALRHGVSLDRRTVQAASGRLFVRETADTPGGYGKPGGRGRRPGDGYGDRRR